MWVVIVRSWEKGTQATAAYVTATYFGPFESEGAADAWVPTCPEGQQMLAVRAPLTPPVVPRKVAVLEPPPG
jgi:hypothetical protein